MDIMVYDYILSGLRQRNEIIEQNYGNSVAGTPPKNPTYPLTIFEEIRNVGIKGYKTCFDKLSSNGYRLDIFAKTKGNVKGQTIARKLAQDFDDYLTNIVGLDRVSYNVSELDDDGAIYHIIMTYEGTLHENRRKFI